MYHHSVIGEDINEGCARKELETRTILHRKGDNPARACLLLISAENLGTAAVFLHTRAVDKLSLPSSRHSKPRYFLGSRYFLCYRKLDSTEIAESVWFLGCTARALHRQTCAFAKRE